MIGSSLNPGVPHEGVDVKVVYELAIKVRVFIFFALAGRRLTLGTD